MNRLFPQAMILMALILALVLLPAIPAKSDEGDTQPPKISVRLEYNNGAFSRLDTYIDLPIGNRYVSLLPFVRLATAKEQPNGTKAGEAEIGLGPKITLLPGFWFAPTGQIMLDPVSQVVIYGRGGLIVKYNHELYGEFTTYNFWDFPAAEKDQGVPLNPRSLHQAWLQFFPQNWHIRLGGEFRAKLPQDDAYQYQPGTSWGGPRLSFLIKPARIDIFYGSVISWPEKEKKPDGIFCVWVWGMFTGP